MKDNSLYEVRCPNNAWKGNSNNTNCNSLCGRVSSMSMGEFWCRKCKINYNFVINEDGEVTYFFEPTELEPRKKKKLTAEDKLFALLESQE